MRVLVKRQSMSVGGDIHRKGDVVEDVSEEEVRKKLKLYPTCLEILPDLPKPKPAPKRAKRKRAHNKNGTFKADDPATPQNEAYVDG